jgi:hypothetical protein
MLESWRYPDANYQDWREWLRVIITMLAEPQNNTAARVVDFDTSWRLGDEFYNLHLDVANWLDPFGSGERRKAIMGTYPYSINEGNWGYDVINPDTGNIYLHFVANARGKNGAFGSSVTVGPVDFTVRQVSLLPNSTPLPFTQVGNMLTINMSGVAADPVSTIVELSATPPLLGDYNLDDVVDAADYVVWRNALGTSVPRFSSADGDGDGLVDPADHGIWRSHFGMMRPGAGGMASGVELSGDPKSFSTMANNSSGFVMPSTSEVRAAGFAALTENLFDSARLNLSGSLQKAAAHVAANIRDDDLLVLAIAKSVQVANAGRHSAEEVDTREKFAHKTESTMPDQLLEIALRSWA